MTKEARINNWLALLGKFKFENGKLEFIGGTRELNGQVQPEIGNFVCDQFFGGGKISASVKFHKPVKESKLGCDIIFYYDPRTKWFACAGVNSGDLFSIRYFTDKWTYIAASGNQQGFDSDHEYRLEVTVKGSTVRLAVDGVEALAGDLPVALPFSQVGIWTIGQTNISVADYRVQPEKSSAFVIMQFSDPFNDVYFEVIKAVCESEDLEVLRIDEKVGPGLITADIERCIREAKIVIAEITPINANVFYEVGIAHALRKPTILLAQKLTPESRLPFDIAGHRVLFYDNSIGGKPRLEAGLKAHLQAILKPR